MKVAKFGGSSLADAQQIRKVCDIITSDKNRRLIVLSAPGKRHKDDIKVTDLLIACAESYLADGCAKTELNNVISRYAEIVEQLKLSDNVTQLIAEDIKKRLDAAGTSSKESFMDSLKAAGEDNCAKLVATYLQNTGFEAHYINPKEAGLLLTNEYGNAQVLPESYENLKNLRDRKGILIFPGFFGYSPDGSVVTFSRGGSDITGSVLAAAVDAEVYENFTDVDSVFSVNPNIISNPLPIHQLTYREMRELSYAGFSIFHEEALVPVYRKGIPVCIKNTNNPASPGTTIMTNREPTKLPVVGIASDDGFCSINISKYLMNREIGFGRRVLEILEAEGLSYEHIPSGIDNISIILQEKQLDNDVEKRTINRIQSELDIDDITVEHNLALVMIVGEGMMHTIGISTRATGAFTKAHVNIEMINQGSSEASMMFGVKAEDSTKAVKALYKEFFENTP